MSTPKRLLIVEDERIVAMDLRKRLEKMGHTVIENVANGNDALKLAAEHHPDLILMDIRIEGDKDGIDTASIIHNTLHIPHIFLTAHSDQSTIDRAKQTDPDGYILKPFTDRDIALNIDIANQRAIFRNELRLSELKFRSLIQNSSDVIFQIDASGTIVFVSPAVTRVLGFNPDVLQGTLISEVILSEDLPTVASILRSHGFVDALSGIDSLAINQVSDSTSPVYRSEVRFRHQDQGYVYTEILSSKIDIPELPVSVVFTTRDISERKRFETELMQAKIKAEEMNRLKSVFLSNISHELRTPLTGILGFASILESELEGEHLDMAQSISKSGQRLLDTMESVMDLALMESNKIDIDPSPLIVSEVVQQVVRMLTGVAFEKNLRIKVIARSEPPVVNTDRRLLSQVLYNLISNAIKFTDKGAITITIEQNIEQFGKDRYHFALIHVKDTGIGISEDFMPYIFDEFRQESTGNTRKYEGTGLGLSIVKRMIGLLHGEVSVQSTVGHGSTFTVKIPVEM
jgi:signal transduction histidine kinase